MSTYVCIYIYIYICIYIYIYITYISIYLSLSLYIYIYIYIYSFDLAEAQPMNPGGCPRPPSPRAPLSSTYSNAEQRPNRGRRERQNRGRTASVLPLFCLCLSPRPATAKVARGRPFDERSEENIPCESKKHRSSMK